jgi:hypothetical protein
MHETPAPAVLEGEIKSSFDVSKQLINPHIPINVTPVFDKMAINNTGTSNKSNPTTLTE